MRSTARAQSERPPPPRLPTLSAGLDAMPALRRLLQVQADALLFHAAPAGAERDPRALHQTRIAIRRLRVLLRGFRKRLKPTRARRLDRELQRLNRSLGQVRDADVWLDRLRQETWPAPLLGTHRWRAFVAHHETRRRRLQPSLQRQLGPRALARLRREFTRLLDHELPLAARQAKARTIEAAARRVLRRHLRQVHEAVTAGAGPSLAEQHRLRIALRRLRYLAGFFAPLLGPPIDRLQRHTHAADRALGELRDAALALAHLAQPPPEPPRRLLAHLRAAHRQAHAAWTRAWRKWCDPAFQRGVRRALRR